MTSATIIPFQPPLPQALPIIAGNADYREFRDNFLHIDELLRQSGRYASFYRLQLKQQETPAPVAAVVQ